jgi:hypothetical protein
MLLSVSKMTRVGRRPCPNFPRHCIYILTNPQILFIPCLTSRMGKPGKKGHRWEGQGWQEQTDSQK